MIIALICGFKSFIFLVVVPAAFATTSKLTGFFTVTSSYTKGVRVEDLNPYFSGFRIIVVAARIFGTKYLVSLGADIRAQNDYAVRLTSFFGHLDIVKYLFEQGADINTKNLFDFTALYMACKTENCFETAELLIEKGAEINAKDNTYYTPLHFACMWGHVEAAKKLIELGANPNIRDVLSMTPMMLAKQNGHTEVVQAMKDIGVKE